MISPWAKTRIPEDEQLAPVELPTSEQKSPQVFAQVNETPATVSKAMPPVETEPKIDLHQPLTKIFAAPEPMPQLDPDVNHQIIGHTKNRWQQEIAKDKPWNPDEHGVMGKIGHVFGQIGNGIANVIAPGQIPGSSSYRHATEGNLVKQINQQQTEEATNEHLGAETNKANVQAKAGALVQISPEMATQIGNPSLAGQSVTQGALQHLMTTASTNKTKETIAGQNNETKRDLADAANLTKEKVSALKPEQRDDRAIRLMQKPKEQLTQEEAAYLGAYAKWVDQTKVQPGVARMNVLNLGRPAQVTDADGNVHYDFMGHAVASGANAPSSMNFRTAVGMAKFMSSGKGGQTMTAYRTANDHLELLQETMEKLNNGDIQGINQLSNRFKTQFGSAAPTNVEAVRTMLAGELANVAKITGATDPEIAEARKNLNSASSVEQMRGVVEISHQLLDQKANEMYQQYKSGMEGKPNFEHGGKRPSGNTPPSGSSEVHYKIVGGKLVAQ